VLRPVLRPVLRAGVVAAGVAALLGWGTTALLAGGLVGALLVPVDGGGLPPVVEPPDPGAYELTVHGDGCGVVRRQVVGADDLPGLQWVLTDPDGVQVLARNALGEDRYRHDLPGRYSVVLEAWDGDGYTPVSDPVVITC
jgi:hypothetical protein